MVRKNVAPRCCFALLNVLVGWPCFFRHQDLMYWGLREDAAVVSAWVAIDPSQPENGCMRAVKGSHACPRATHGQTAPGDENLLSIGQNITLTREQQSQIVDLRLDPGQASFHHGALHVAPASAIFIIGMDVQTYCCCCCCCMPTLRV
jgi:hypothetical protein